MGLQWPVVNEMIPHVYTHMTLYMHTYNNVSFKSLFNRPLSMMCCYWQIRIVTFSSARSQTYRRIKLMVVGEDNKGKTSLLLSLTRQGSMVRFREVALDHRHQPLATNGVELGDWEYAPRGRQKVTFMTWDFGGQVSSYTHTLSMHNSEKWTVIL